MRAMLLLALCFGVVSASLACSGGALPKPQEKYASIFEAAQAGDWAGIRDCMRVLGEEVSQVDANGDSVLHYAAKGGSEEVIRHLVEFGAQIDVRDAQDKTPLQIAQEAGQTKAVEVLKELGATE